MVSYIIENGIEGVFAYNDVAAIQLENALQKAGKRVPEDINIIGYDGTPIVRRLHPNLPTIVQPIAAAASQLVEVLFALIKTPRTTMMPDSLLPVSLYLPKD
ncbi:substrate-binding domain-containing protein [Leuconostoc falkenbergense]|uniref:substrate-binding domain-containing protein n=1 Tax=Leuconostoc falkenbergense TaxID=2766470 RepID=UPI0021A9C8ED|nr:substrate-binding domain-containing protein [Leuconostoc falkenbergense]